MNVPCVDLDLEAQFVGSCMADPEIVETLRMAPSELYARRHQTILETVQVLAGRGHVPDATSVVVELKRAQKLEGVGGEATVRAIADRAAVYPKPIWEALKDLSRARKIREHSLRAVALAEGGDVVEAAREAETAGSIVSSAEDGRYGTIQGAVREALNDVKTRAQRGRPAFVASGIQVLDEAIGGFEYGDLTVIGGDTSVGKTSTALLMACAMSRAGHRPGVISCEDAAPRMGRRVLSMLSGVPAKALRKGNLSPWQWEQLGGAVASVNGLEIVLAYTIGETLDVVTEATRVLIREHKCDVIFLDYAQAVRVPGFEERTAMREVLSNFKRECTRGEHPASGFVLSQFKRRDNVHDQPKRSDLYESGYLEQKADGIVLLWRDQHGIVRGVLDKAKDDATGVEFALERDTKTGMLREV